MPSAIGTGFAIILALIAVFVFLIMPNIRIIQEWERAVVLRLGRYNHIKGPGIRFLLPFIDRMIRVDLRVVTMDVPKQDMMTKDNVPMIVDAVVYFQVVNPEAAILNVEQFVRATSLKSQTTLRSVIGQSQLDELLSERDKINQHLQTIIDEETEPWGVKVTSVEVRDVLLPEGMKRAMARQAETERERRAKVINAQGEYEAAEKLSEAAKIIAAQPQALQLRYLQTLAEIAGEQNSTTIFPIPLDLLSPFAKMAEAFTEKIKKDSEG